MRSPMPGAAGSPSRSPDRRHWPCVSRVTDRGPGIADLDAVLEGRTAGQGIAGARRLVDDFTITSGNRPAPP